MYGCNTWRRLLWGVREYKPSNPKDIVKGNTASILATTEIKRQAVQRNQL